VLGKRSFNNNKDQAIDLSMKSQSNPEKQKTKRQFKSFTSSDDFIDEFIEVILDLPVQWRSQKFSLGGAIAQFWLKSLIKI